MLHNAGQGSMLDRTERIAASFVRAPEVDHRWISLPRSRSVQNDDDAGIHAMSAAAGGGPSSQSKKASLIKSINHFRYTDTRVFDMSFRINPSNTVFELCAEDGGCREDDFPLASFIEFFAENLAIDNLKVNDLGTGFDDDDYDYDLQIMKDGREVLRITGDEIFDFTVKQLYSLVDEAAQVAQAD